MEARNRKIEDWYGKIERGEIKLPRFQRFEAWDWRRISSLMTTITKNLPLGITLILEVGEKEQFISRYLSTAPETNGRVFEQLLDGQQRLTSLWRVLNNNYEYETYFVHIPKFDKSNDEEDNANKEVSIFCRGRYMKQNGKRYPLWCDNPQDSLWRGMIPAYLLRPGDIQKEIDKWIEQATIHYRPKNPDGLETFFYWKKEISDFIKDLRSTIKNYNLPYLSLPSDTPKDVALEVFINMNTNSKPLSMYDIIVAEIESVKGESLHELQEKLDKKHPEIKHYFGLDYLILNTSALLQEKLPNQRGLWEMDKAVMVDNWDRMELGLNEMANFLHQEGILDRQRLPTNAVLSVLAGLFPYVSTKLDARGAQLTLLKKYLWSSFFTNRYENAAASHAYYDYLALKKVLNKKQKENGDSFTEKDVPVLNRKVYPIAEPEELVTASWPKRETIRGKAVLAVSIRLGANDFATGEKVLRSNIGKQHYHHIFPDALLKEAEVDSFFALNCAIIQDKTNLDIKRKDPLKYLQERYEWTTEAIVHDRLNSHLIPITELSNGGYDDIGGEKRVEKIKSDFELFMKKRAEYFHKAALLLTEGKKISIVEIMND